MGRYHFLPIMTITEIADTNIEADYFEMHLGNISFPQHQPSSTMQSLVLPFAFPVI